MKNIIILFLINKFLEKIYDDGEKILYSNNDDQNVFSLSEILLLGFLKNISPFHKDF